MPVHHYLNFDLSLGRLGEDTEPRYRAEVVESPVGQATADFTLPFSPAELNQLIEGVERAGRRYQFGDETNVGLTASTLTAETFGRRLFAAIFANDLDTCLLRSLDAAERQAAGMRIRLRLDATVPELARLPWEYLYIPVLARFVVLSNQTTLVRYIKLGQREETLQVTAPLRILGVVANPMDVAPLKVEQEWQQLVAATENLQTRGLINLERLDKATMAALRQRLRQDDVHILHFIGHGFFDQATGRGGLILENETGGRQAVEATALASRLHDHPALRLVFLNACQGAEGDRATFFANTAQKLVQQGIPAVIAMQYPISDRAAIVLAAEFYQAVASGYPVDAALSEARRVIYEQDTTLSEWGTPVIFMRTPDGLLFELPAPIPAVAPPTKPAISPIWRQPMLVLVVVLIVIGISYFWSALRNRDLSVTPTAIATIAVQSQAAVTGRVVSPTQVYTATLTTLPDVTPLLTATISPAPVAAIITSPFTTTVRLALVDCPETRDAVAQRLSKQFAGASPPFRMVNDNTELADWGLQCTALGKVITYTIQVLQSKGALEVYEPISYISSALETTQVVRLGLAFALYQYRDYPRAAELFRGAALHATDVKTQAMFTLFAGNSLLFAGEYEAAVAQYTEAIHLQPTWVGLHHNFSVALMNQQWFKNTDFAGVRAAFSQTLQLDPNFALTWLVQGQLENWIGALWVIDDTPFRIGEQACQRALIPENTLLAEQAEVCLAYLQIAQHNFGFQNALPNRTVGNWQIAPDLWGDPLLVRALQGCAAWKRTPEDLITREQTLAALTQALPALRSNVSLEYKKGWIALATECWQKLQ